MELTSGTWIIVVVVAIAAIALLRWGRRNEAGSVDSPVRSSREERVSQKAPGDSQSLLDRLLERASQQAGVNVADDPLARDRIAQAASRAMEDLRTSGSATISLPFLVADARGPMHFNVRVKRNLDTTFELLD